MLVSWKIYVIDLRKLSDIVVKEVVKWQCKLSNVVSKGFVKQTVLNKLNTKVNNLENKTPDASNLIQTNHTFKEKSGDVENKIPDTNG